MTIVKQLAEYRKEIDLDFIKKTHVHYCTPCYAGQISEPYFRSWTKGHMMFTKYDIPYSITTSANESLISRARCHMVAYFMANPEATQKYTEMHGSNDTILGPAIFIPESVKSEWL